ncbi:hypothetical protein [Desulfobacula toluolica]|uniref:Conserved uncharacterized putative membrane protein n=1 Tax=Desulfobacula toluolica (strain DSM 7467 / Tol2) TaxID=651182 RepID=K0NNF7_DESTT|nr:hypothetical protein [Desulfobacula toluolica]CCK80292.1 conserved uncharacterized putative membrane protein [Desulfobacula toluolica Tol2]
MHVFDVFNKKSYAIILILCVSFSCFYPLLDAGVIDFDDTSMILKLNTSDENFSIKKLYWPKNAGRYYRPLLMHSFVVDSKIWAFEPSGYHLTNIIFHTLNALIFYLIVLKLFKNELNYKYIAFFLSVLFVLHPLTIESVAWISGRTDILSVFFSLLAFLFYLLKKHYSFIFVPLSIFLGMLAKENAICAVPIIVLYEFVSNYPSKDFKQTLITVLKWVTILIIPLFIYSFLRFNGFGLFDAKMPTAAIKGDFIEPGLSSLNQMFSNFYLLPAVIGFYIKKIFIPLPLNFAISQINVVLYSALSGVLCVLNILLLKKKKFAFPFWLLFIIIAFLPALPVALADIAWTMYAERYLYMTVPLLCLFAGDLYLKNLKKFTSHSKRIKIIICLLFLGLTIVTIQRISIWKSKESIWADTYKKNLTHGKVLYKYGSILGSEKGLPFFKFAVAHAKDNEWRDFSLLIVAQDEANKLNYNKAYDLIQEALKINSERQNCYQAAGILKQIIKDESLREDKYNRLLIQCYQLAYKKKPKPVDLSNIIRIFESLNDEKNAEKYSKMLIEKFPRSRAAKYILSKFNN